jgi:colanic acid/amylovoran biosynthesis glycosyltransferase
MKLAVITAQLGTVSETFIRRHVEDIYPGETVAIALSFAHPFGGRWSPPCPVLFMDRVEQGLVARIRRRLGAANADLRMAVAGRFLRRRGVEVVLGEYLNLAVEFVPLLDRLGIPYVVQGHGIDVSAALRDPDMAHRYLAYRSARAVLTRCEFHRQRLIQLGLPSEIVRVNPGGIDIPEVVPVRPVGAGKRLLAVGRMLPKKGPLHVLEAFRLASLEDSALTLDYVGDGVLFESVQAFVTEHGLGTRVRLHGAASEAVKVDLLASCGVFVQHSLTDPETGDEEGLPAAIQEAMAYGMAVVSTRHSGIPEAIEDGVAGLLSDEGDSAGMARSLLAAAKGEAWAAFGAAGRAKAAEQYSWSAERGRLLACLERANILASSSLRAI